ncbi:hypothetical protein LWP59_16025 [Amycolatopsis acidiphila]|uniref:Uncharacterized protein n=1 Tax=Amycolatopsis acidiphila TaxID=715473 RepID=A0A557ZXS5_9PSEU|nr:hypothetical protein [Amycolatopsis acidiphila]TVT16823.1 hypothetical protein FNH06_33765 [Amycolatopsis acidiphila]UIJ63024.1 hypothetical protein LWP59_16025 [Amycolatopsis acidiphila]GHG65710.1 hypothetical protein GCM10017788_23370 [Amycolatopsis acidiphila]
MTVRDAGDLGALLDQLGLLRQVTGGVTVETTGRTAGKYLVAGRAGAAVVSLSGTVAPIRRGPVRERAPTRRWPPGSATERRLRFSEPAPDGGRSTDAPRPGTGQADRPRSRRFVVDIVNNFIDD